MNIKMQKISVVIIAVVLCVATFVLPAKADQPFMQSALNDLKAAHSYLKKATADKGGYRQQALDLVRDALSETQKGIEYDRRN